MVGLVVAQVASLLLGTCQNGAVASCTISGCVQAQKVCVGGQWDPCECIVWNTLNCDDGNPCTTDTNVNNSYCQYSINVGTSCVDTDVCRGTGTCSSVGACEPGISVPITDTDPSTYDYCGPPSSPALHHDSGTGSGTTLDSSPATEGYEPPGTAPNPLEQPVPSMPTAGGPTVNESTGDLGYSYAFDLPVARGRYQPRLGIAYSSALSRDEGVGLGWVMSTSYIELDSNTWPDSSGGVYIKPRLVMQASSIRLIPITGSATWVPESGRGFVSLTNEGTYWDGRDMEGNLYTFAAQYSWSATDPLRKRYYLSSVVDVDGNRTTYSYSGEDAFLAYVSRITYNEYNDTTGHTNYGAQVDLVYAPVAPPRVTPVGGVAAKVTRNLSSVAVSVRSPQDVLSQLRHYTLQYDTASTTNLRSLLTSVRLTNDAGSTPIFFPQTQFTYEVPGAGYSLSTTALSIPQALPVSTSGTDSVTAAWVDVDGDGRVDRVFFATDHLEWWQNTSSPGTPSFVSKGPLSGSTGSVISTVTIVRDGTYGQLRVTSAAMLDVNDDGLVDLVAAGLAGQSKIDVKLGQLDSNHNFSFLPTDCFDTSNATSSPVISKDGLEGLDDVNGDGVVDYFKKNTDGTETVYLGYWRGTGTCRWAFANGVSGATVKAYKPGSAGTVGLRYGTDGSPISTWGYQSVKAMPLAPTSCTNTLDCPTNRRFEIFSKEIAWDPRQTQALRDLNGDGQADLIERESDAQGKCGPGTVPCKWAIWWGNGGGFVWSGIEIPSLAGTCGIDFFSFPESYTQPDLETCTCDDDVLPVPNTTTVNVSGAFSAWESGFIDIDGDGVLDWVVNRVPNGTCGATTQWTAYLGTSQPALLRTVAIPSGAIYSVAYRRAEEFKDDTNNDFPRTMLHRVSRQLVWSISLAGLPSGSSRIPPASTYYWYERPSVGAAPDDPFGVYAQEPRGFTKTMVYDDAAKIGRVTTWVTSSHVLAGSPAQMDVGELTVSSPSPGAWPPLSPFRQVFNSNLECQPAGANGRIYPIVGQMLSLSVVSGLLSDSGAVVFRSSQSTSCADVDRFGNVSKVTRDPDLSVTGDEIIENTTFDSSAMCVACPVETESWSGTGAATPLSKKLYYYDSAGGSWNAPLSQGRAGNGHINYVVDTVWYQSSSWTERASGTAYNADGTVAFRVVDPDAGSSGRAYTDSYTYDSQHLRVVKTTRSDGTTSLVTDVTYDNYGRKTVEVGPYVSGSAAAKPQRAYAYDAASRVIAVGRSISSGGVVTGPIAAAAYVNSARGQSRQYTFLAPRTDFVVGSPPSTPDVRVVVSHLDDLGRVVEVRERLGGTGGTGAADPTSNIIANLSGTRVLSTSYDAMGRVVASADPTYRSADENTYEGFATVVSGGRGAASIFDARGRISCSLSGMWSTAVKPLRDALLLGTGTCTSSPGTGPGHVLATSYAYETQASPMRAVGRMTPPRSPATALTSGDRAAYRPDGRLEWVKDAYGNQTLFTYDIPTRSTTVTRQASGVAGSAQTLSRYTDSKGRVVSETDDNWSPHVTPSRTYSYDAQDRVVSAWLAPMLMGSARVSPQMHYEYKSLGRRTLVSVSEPTASSGGVSYTLRTIASYAYDTPYAGDTGYTYVAGRVSAITTPLTTIAVGYDQNGNPSKRAQWFTGLSGAFVTTSSTSDDGRMLTSSVSSGYSKTVTWKGWYDSAGRAVEMNGGTGPVKFWEAVSQGSNGAYDALGRVIQSKSNNSLVLTTRAFDPNTTRLTSLVVGNGSNKKYYSMENAVYLGDVLKSYRSNSELSDSTYTSFAYAYDANGRLKTATATPTGSDGLNQSYNEVYSQSDPSWAVGATIGNLETVTQTLTQGVVTQDYQYSSDRVIKRDPTVAGTIPSYPNGSPWYVHDHAGRLAGGWTTTEVEGYGYDVEDHLKVVRSSGAVVEMMEYGPEGELLYRKEGTKAYFFVGGQATVSADVPSACTGYGGTNCTVSNVKVAVHLGVGGTRVVTVRAVAGSGTDAAGDVLYYHRDVRGSVVATTLTGGVVGVKYRYGPYGAETYKQIVTASGESELGFTGGVKLATNSSDTVAYAKLILLGARVYHVDLRRWLQPDSVDLKRYTYANGDPVNLTDPSGRMPKGDLFRLAGYYSLDQFDLREINGLNDTIDFFGWWYENKRLWADATAAAASGSTSAAQAQVNQPPSPPPRLNLGNWAQQMTLEAPPVLLADAKDVLWNLELQGAWAIEGFGSGVSLTGSDAIIDYTSGNTLLNRDSKAYRIGRILGYAWLTVATLELISAMPPAAVTAGGGAGAIGVTGKLGEQFLKTLGGQSQVYFRTSLGGRFVDQLVDGIAHESKVGYTALTEDVAAQISKDVELIATRQIQGSTWHFFESPLTGLCGPSGPLRAALVGAGIQVVEHH